MPYKRLHDFLSAVLPFTVVHVLACAVDTVHYSTLLESKLLVAGGNPVDCSAAVTAQNADFALTNNIADDCTASSQTRKTGNVTVCVNFMMAWIGEGTCNGTSNSSRTTAVCMIQRS